MGNIAFSNEKIEIKGSPYFRVLGVAAFGMAAMGISFFCGLFPFEEDDSLFVNVFGAVFMGIWILIALTGSVYGFTVSSSRIVLDENGVTYSSLLRKYSLAWCDVRDWGLSYCGQTRGEGNTYYLYFSDHPCKTKNSCSKKLTGKSIKTYVFEAEYSLTLNVVPFVSQRTSVEPFIGEDTFHLI